MDPNTALANARQAADEYENASSLGMEADAAERLIAAFRALDTWLSDGGFPPGAWWQRIKAEPAPPADEDPHERFQMYTPEGNAAVAAMLQPILDAALALPTRDQMDGMRRDQTVMALRNGLRKVAEVHPEIRDTATRETIMNAVDDVFDRLGWLRPQDGSL